MQRHSQVSWISRDPDGETTETVEHSRHGGNAGASANEVEEEDEGNGTEDQLVETPCKPTIALLLREKGRSLQLQHGSRCELPEGRAAPNCWILLGFQR